MPLIEMLILGLALSMDAFAVTISNLMAHPGLTRTRRLLLPVVFGLFQGLMPLIGYFAGSVAADLIDSFAGPIALIILGIIGGRMVFQAIREMRSAKKGRSDPHRKEDVKLEATNPQTVTSQTATLSLPAIFIQGVATSIDALIVGVSLLAMNANIFQASSVIAVTTFACCLVGLVLGRRFGTLLGDKAQLIGGVVLIAIGIKACFF